MTPPRPDWRSAVVVVDFFTLGVCVWALLAFIFSG
jgi:hypothetical protein